MLLLLFIGQQPAPSQPGFANLSLAVSDLWPPLNATGPGDAVHWTATELFAWMDEAAKQLAGARGPFVVRDESLASAVGAGSYSLPATHLATISVDLAGRSLRPRTVRELEALDADWPDTEGEPKSFVQDTQGFDKLVLYPKPEVGPETIGLVMATVPVEISAAAAVVAVPPVMREYFSFHALAEARRKDSRGSMDEVVGWLGELAGLYVGAAGQYWGIQ